MAQEHVLEGTMAAAGTTAQNDALDAAEPQTGQEDAFEATEPAHGEEEEQDNFDDLSEELSSVHSADSPPHRRLKEQRAAAAADAAQLLEACAREDADNAAAIKKCLKERFGKSTASEALRGYTEHVLRKGPGAGNQRLLLDANHCPMRLKLA